MIEIVAAERCIGCNMCVRVCPMNVFDKVAGGTPVIARQDDCQSCFMCELYCPTDALYVSPLADEPSGRDPQEVAGSGVLGSYARAMGWQRGRAGGSERDLTYRLRVAP